MRFYGFATRDYLVLDNISLNKKSSVLEIGVGAGSTANLIIGKVKEYCGVDISRELIDWLKCEYKNDCSVNFYSVDVCKDSSLGKKLDIIISADTLEHVEVPKGFFNYISRHLSSNGVALIAFPNESEYRHHGISWFNNKKELLDIIDSSGLKVLDLCQVKSTFYHDVIRKLLWDIPTSIATWRTNALPQSFENTKSFEIIKAGGIRATIFGLYAKMVTSFARCFPLYHLIDLTDENISDRVLLMHLIHESNSSL